MYVTYPDHIHMFVRIPPKYSVSEIMGYLKGNIEEYIRNQLKADDDKHKLIKKEPLAKQMALMYNLLEKPIGHEVPICPQYEYY